MSHQPSPKNYRQLSQTERDSHSLPREEHISWLSSTERMTLKTHILVTLYELNRLFSCVRAIYIYSNTYKHAMTTDKKEAVNLKKSRERDKGGRKGKREML